MLGIYKEACYVLKVSVGIIEMPLHAIREVNWCITKCIIRSVIYVNYK